MRRLLNGCQWVTDAQPLIPRYELLNLVKSLELTGLLSTPPLGQVFTGRGDCILSHAFNERASLESDTWIERTDRNRPEGQFT